MQIFERLNAINVNGHVETKGQGANALRYLSWAWAWAEVKKAYPMSYYTIYEAANGCLYHTDGKTCWVKAGVTLVEYVDGERRELEHIEYLPIMDMRNQSIPLASVTSMNVNKSIQRALTKACSRHGLALYLFAGEDLPENDAPQTKRRRVEPKEINRSAEAQKMLDKVDEAIRAHTSGMNAEQKKQFAAELKTLCGVVNYKTLEDEAAIRRLYDKYVKE